MSFTSNLKLPDYITSAEKLLLDILHENADKGWTYKKMCKYSAKKMNVSRREVERLIEKLQDYKLISITG